MGGRILVTGATGFIGGRVCERLAAEGTHEVRALVHSRARAGRISTLPIEKYQCDLLDSSAVASAVTDCSAVVHLAAGSTKVLVGGTRNLLKACAISSIDRFVLMSTVRVYGTLPPPESAHESAALIRTGDDYGDAKQHQESLALRFQRRTGIPVVILRPPSVYGPHDFFSRDLLDGIERRRLALVDDGSGVCESVYIDNLVDAVLLALETEKGIGEAFFITDGNPVSWRECLTWYAELLGRNLDLPRISGNQLVGTRRTGASLSYRTLKLIGNYLTSPRLSERIIRLPLSSTLKARLKYLCESTLPTLKDTLREDREFKRVFGVLADDGIDLENDYLHAQLRNVVHSIDKARSLLAYEPRFSRSESLEITRGWLKWCGLIT